MKVIIDGDRLVFMTKVQKERDWVLSVIPAGVSVITDPELIMFKNVQPEGLHEAYIKDLNRLIPLTVLRGLNPHTAE